MAVEYKNIAIILLGGFAIIYGLWGILQRKLDFGLRGGMGHKYKITLQGNYAIGGAVGVIIGGLLFVLPAFMKNQFDLSDALIGMFNAVGLVVMFSGVLLAAAFQFAVNLGRDLGEQPTEEE